MPRRIRFGTRGSKLALTQTQLVCDRLAATQGWDDEAAESAMEVVVIQTMGDRIQDPAERNGDVKGLFTKELEEALLRQQIDVAVHSIKDLLTQLPTGLCIGAVLPREDPRDAFVSCKYTQLSDLDEGAVIGTSSPRRRAQALSLRPDLTIRDLRGNVENRLKKVESQKIDATFLAVAGLKRLNLEDKITDIIPSDDMLPACGQGAIGLQVREDDTAISKLLTTINDTRTLTAVTAERAVLQVLYGSCKTPIACLAELKTETNLRLRAQVLLPDGSDQERIEACVELSGDPVVHAADIGRNLGEEFKANAETKYFNARTQGQE